MSERVLPKTIGGYEILDRIAVGGMAEIFLARTRGFGGFEKRLVVKRLHDEYADDDSFVRMLIDEARITAQLQHANIVQVFDLGTERDQVFMAMEYVEGKDLFQVLRELHRRELHMPLEAACYIVAEACLGLHYAHTRRDPHSGDPLGIVHRDVSPQNLLLSWHGEVKVGDFGIVKANVRSTHTQAGVIKGKFYYMSPEQARGQDLDPRSDLFSAGIVLYEALTASPLYDEGDDNALLERVRQADVQLPSATRSDVPPELDAICKKALERDRNRRFGTGLEMARALTGWAQRGGHGFTKVDLADFMAALFDPSADTEAVGTATDPDLMIGDPGVTIDVGAVGRAAVDSGRSTATVSAPNVHAGRSATSDTADAPVDVDIAGAETLGGVVTRGGEGADFGEGAGRGPADPTRALRLSARPTPADAVGAAPVPDDKTLARMVAPVLEPADSAERPAVPRRGDGEPYAHDATARLSRVEIAALNEKILQSMRPKSDAVRGAAASAQADAAPAAGPVAFERPGRGHTAVSRIGLEPRPPAVHPRDRQMRWLISVVSVAAAAVATVIVWLVLHPVQASAAAAGPAPVMTPAPRDSAATPRRAPPASAERVPAQESVTAARTATVDIALSPPSRRIKLYVDGELTIPVDGRLALPAGTHTFSARLFPEGTQTPEITLELEPGSTTTLPLP